MEITAAYYIIFLLLVAILIYSAVAYYRNPEKKLKTALDIQDGTLEETLIILDSDKTRRTLFGTAGSTLALYVFLQPSDKTPRADQVPNTLLEIPGVLRFNYGATSTELAVVTFNTQTRQAAEEIITIPKIPMQKWVLLTILRDGRRFDIMYNDKMVASKRLEYMPVYLSAALRIGGPRIRGTFREGHAFNYRLSLSEVSKELASSSDTRHKPPTSIELTIGNPFALFSCPGGFFCREDSRKPISALQEWQTPYA